MASSYETKMTFCCEDGKAKLLVQEEKEGKPKWLEGFLSEMHFFQTYSKHHLNNNDDKKMMKINLFCIQCGISICRLCKDQEGHSNHKMVQVYRHGHQEAIRLNDLKPYMNCNKIQTFQGNKNAVITLHSLMPEDTKKGNVEEKSPSPTPPPLVREKTGGIHCDMCPRLLHIGRGRAFKFCSIHCKVSAFMSKEDGSEPPFLEPGTEGRKRNVREMAAGLEQEQHDFEDNENEVEEDYNSAIEGMLLLGQHPPVVLEEPAVHRNKRKSSIPRRAPFF